jgi:integrase
MTANIKTTLSPAAYKWHRRPEDFDGPCPVCECPLLIGEHRAVRPEEGLRSRWVQRYKSPRGYRNRLVRGERLPTKPAKPRKVSRKGVPNQETLEGIVKATRLLAEGRPMVAIAKELGITPRALEYWRQHHPTIWQHNFRLAVQGVVSRVRKTAGTDQVLTAPDEYLRLATMADKWTAENDEELFPSGGPDLSVCGFFRAYYLRNCLAGAVPETIRQYEIALNLWRRITGDPPIRLVTNDVVAKFRDVLLSMKGRGGRPMSPNTVRSKLRQLQAIFDAAGPSGPRHRDAAGILAKIPYAKPPAEVLDTPRIVREEWLNAVYKAAVAMDSPDVFGIKPRDWWQALLSLTLNTALRRGTLFSLRWEFVDWKDRTLHLPYRNMKAKRGHLIPLNRPALEHLERIKSASEVIFPWPYSRECFDDKFKLLQGLAGIPAGERFGLHAIRRTAATLLWERSPQAAQIVLGHTSALITLRHYVQPKAAAAALESLPQPWVTLPATLPATVEGGPSL